MDKMCKLKKNRLIYGITLTDIAKKAFVPLETLTAWEEGTKEPRDGDAVRRVADYIKCDIRDLVSPNSQI